ncbi:RNase adapter RapZ [Glycomyces xiaoerkulensis]|uniref:RNase adapter RapZ n=1 Tax=Glycomyces xiaoerkulensis TaxID=2038139 RepID=UPI000C2638B3|nr:RNase adapter RapZ [Glycomyces xiaoerkulensis]
MNSADEGELDLVIVTGISGGGRSTVARALENVGYYVVDNLPESLVAQAAELAAAGGSETRRTAMVLDVRARAFMTDLVGVIEDLRKAGFKPHLVFVDADDDVIIRRFEKVRRAHPLQGDGLLGDGIAAERRLLEPARNSADTLFDTTHLNENQLRDRVEKAFLAPSTPGLQFTCMSFGFKYGIPRDADYVADVRFLPNPYWVPSLREHTGTDEAVSDYVLDQDGAEAFVEAYASLLLGTTEGFEREGKRYMTIAIGCTGGKHRSVAITEELARRLGDAGFPANTHHRDRGNE